MKTVEIVLKAGTGLACAYEAFSLATGLTPTISREVGLYPWLGLPVLVGLGAHLYWAQLKALFSKK